MKTATTLALSLLISSLAFAQAAPAKTDKAAAKAAAKAATKAVVKGETPAAQPAQPVAQTGDGKTADAKPADTKPVEAAAADGAAHSCPCDKKIAGLKDGLAMHEGALEMLKKDPVLKIKGFKGKAKKMYKKKAKQDKAFHKGMAKLLKKRIRFLDKMHSGGECKMHKAMQDAPPEVMAIIKERHAKMEERMKAHGAKMGEMHGDHP